MRRKLPVLGILLLAMALRVYNLAHLSIWLDESYSIAAAQLPLPGTLQFIAARSHPPLYFLLLHGWIALGDGEFMVRFLSVIWGVVGVAAVYVLGRRIGGERVGQVAAVLLAVSPIHVWHSQDARMYTLLFALSTLSSYFLILALTRRRLGYWLGYGLFAALSLYTHNTIVFTLLAQGLFAMVYVAFRREWSLLRGVGLAVVIVGLGYVPWLPTAASQAAHIQRYFWPSSPTVKTVPDTFAYLSSALLFTDSPWFSNLDAWPGSLVYLTFLGLFLLGAWQFVRRRTTWSLFLFLLIAIPIAGELVASLARPVYLNRTLLVTAAPLFVVYGAGVTPGQGWSRKAALVLLTIGLGCNLFSLVNLYRNGEKEEWRQAAALVASQAQADDVLFFDQGLIQIPFDYYYHDTRPLIPEFGYPQESTFWCVQQKMDQDEWWVVDYLNSDPDAALSRLTGIAGEHPDVWLVENRPLSEGRLVTWLTENSDRSQQYSFPWVTVYRFEMSRQG